MPAGRSKARIVIFSIILIALIAGAAAIYFPVAKYFKDNGEELKSEIIRYLEDLTGRKVNIDNIEPGFLSFLSVNNLSLRSKDNAGAVLVFNKVKIFYSVFDLLTGNIMPAIREIRIENSSISINETRDKDVLDFLSKISTGGGGPQQKIDLILSVRNSRISYSGEAGDFILDDIFFKADLGDEKYDLSLNASAKGSLALADPANFYSKIRIRGSMGPKFDWASLRCSFPEFNSDIFSAKDQSFQILLSDNKLRIAKILDSEPIDISANINLDDRSISVSLETEEYVPGRTFILVPKNKNLAPWLSSSLSGQAYFFFSSDENIQYNVSMEINADNRYLNTPATLKTELFGDKSFVYLNEFSIATKAGGIEYKGNIALDNWLPLPNGTLIFNNLTYFHGYEIAGALKFSRGFDNKTQLSYKNLNVNSINFESGECDFSIFDGGFNFAWLNNFNNQTKGSLNAEGSMQIKPVPSFKLQLQGDNLPASIIGLALTSVRGNKFLSQSILSAGASIQTDFKSVNFLVPSLEFLNGDNNLALLCSAKGTEKSVVVENIAALFGVIRGGGSALLNFNSDSIKFQTNLEIQDNPYLLSGEYNAKSGLSINGNYGLKFSYIPGRLRNSVSLHCDNMPLRLAKENSYLFADLKGWTTDKGFLIKSSNSGISDLPIPLESNSIFFSGIIDDQKALFTNILARDSVSELRGIGSAELDLGATKLSNIYIFMKDVASKENYLATMDLDLKSGKLNSSVKFKDSPFSRFPQLPLIGNASGDVKINGELSSPNIEINVDELAANYDFDVISGDFKGTADVMDLLNSPDIKISLDQIRSELDLGVIKSDFTASAEIDNPQADPEISVSVNDFKGSLNAGIVKSDIEAMARLDLFLKNEETEDIIQLIDGGIKLRALRDFISKLVDKEGPIKSRLISLISLGSGTISGEAILGEFEGRAGMASSLDINDFGIQLALNNAIISTKELIFGISAGLSGGGSFTGKEIVGLLDLIEDGLKFNDIVKAYASEDFADFRNSFFINSNDNQFSLKYGPGPMDLAIDGNIDISLAKGLLALASSGSKITATSFSDNAKITLPGIISFSGNYNQDEILQVIEFLDLIKNLNDLEKMTSTGQLPAAFWNTYFNLTLENGSIELSDDDYNALFSVDAKINGALDELSLRINPKLDAQVHSGKDLFRGQIDGNLELNAGFDNRHLGVLLELLSRGKTLRELNEILAWSLEPEIIAKAVLGQGIVKTENLYLPLSLRADINSDFKFLSTQIVGEIAQGHITTSSFYSEINAGVQSLIHAEFINFDSVMTFLNSPGDPEDLRAFIKSLFQTVDNATEIKVELSKGTLSGDNYYLPFLSNATLRSNINNVQIGEFIKVFQDLPDPKSVFNRIADIPLDSELNEAVKKLVKNIINNDFTLDKLEDAFYDYPDLAGILSSMLNADLKINGGRVDFPGFSGNLNAAASIQGNLNDPLSRIEVNFEDAEISAPGFSGTINAMVRFEGSLASPEIELKISDAYGKLFGREFNLLGSIKTSKEVIDLSGINIKLDVMEVNNINGKLNCGEGLFAINGNLGGGFRGNPLSGDLSLLMKMERAIKKTEILSLGKVPFAGNFELSEIKLGDDSLDYIKFAFLRDNEKYSISSNEKIIFALEYFDDGDITANFKKDDALVTFKGIANENLYEGNLSIDEFPLSFFKYMKNENLGPIYNYLSSFKLNLKAIFRTGFDQYSFAAPTFTLNNDNGESVQIKLSGNSGLISLEKASYSNGKTKFSADADLITGAGQSFTLNGNVNFNSLDYEIQAEGNNNNIKIYSPEGLFAEIVSGDDDRVFFNLKIDDLPFDFNKDENCILSVDSSGNFKSPEDWTIYESSITLKNLPLPIQESFVSAKAAANNQKGLSAELIYSDSISSLSGSARIDFSPKSEENINNIVLDLSSPDGQEKYTINGVYRERDLDFRVIIQRSPMKRLPGYPAGGFLSGDLLVNSMIYDPTVNYSVQIDEGLLLGRELSLDIAGTYDETNLSMASGWLNLLDVKLASLSGGLDLKDGSFNITGGYRGILTGDTVNSSVVLDGAFAGISDESGITDLFAADIGGSFFMKDITVGEEKVGNWNFPFNLDKEGFSFSGGPKNGVKGGFSEDNSFYLSFSKELPISFEAKGSIKNNALAADIKKINIFLPSIKRFLKIPFVSFVDGNAVGDDLRIAGPLNDPNFYGELRASKVKIKTDYIPEDLGPVETIISFDEKELYIPMQFLNSDFNNLEFDGRFFFEQWTPKTYNLAFKTVDKAGAHLHLPVTVLDVDGYGIGEFFINGDLLFSEMSGQFTVFNCDISQGDAKKTGAKSKSSFDYTIAMDFVTGRNVDFSWPKTPKIVKASAKANQTVRVFYDTRDRSMIIKGDVEIQSGTVLWLQKNFYLRGGKLAFNENEKQFDPKITTKAVLNDVSSEGERVEIYLILNNDPIKNLSPEFESQPFMPAGEIAAIIGKQTYIDSNGESYDLAANTLFLTADILSQVTIIKDFEEKVQDLLNLDMFSIRTQMIQNALYDKVFQGDLGLEGVNPIGKYLDNTTLLFGKHFNDNVYLEALVRINANEYNTAVGSFTDSLTLNSEIRIEWDTPLFLLDFSFEPDFGSLGSTINSANLGLSWNFQF